jgi:hypothetical protein
MNQNTKYETYPYKTCPYCGQGTIPFKLGVCICGKQIGNIQYVQNADSFARNYYSYVGNNISGNYVETETCVFDRKDTVARRYTL